MTDTAAAPPPVVDADPLAGTAYRVIRRIGAGAMGHVFEAEHVGLRRRVALKLLTPALADDPAFVDRLRLEAQALASVRHPNVVVIHDHAATPGGVPFLAMELLEGRTLQELLRERGALPLLPALCLVDQIFAGLTAIHAAGLTHRDLKPANIFLSEERGRTVVKLLDFGIVKVTGRDAAPQLAPLRFPTELGHALGTPRFMAPEQVTGAGCDARTDVYAAGVLLFLMLSGRDPFHEHRTHVAILTAHVKERPPLLSSVASQPIPPGVDAAIARALAKDPADRFASIAGFGAALGAALDGPSRTSRLPAATEKMPARPARVSATGTAPLDVTAFRPAASVLPFAQAALTGAKRAAVVRAPSSEDGGGSSVLAARPPPSFGLPPLPAPPEAAPRAPSPPRSDPPARDRPRGLQAPEDNRLLFAIVAALWGIVLVVAWRVL